MSSAGDSRPYALSLGFEFDLYRERPRGLGHQVQVDNAFVADLDLSGTHEVGRGWATVGHLHDEVGILAPSLYLMLSTVGTLA